MKKQVHLILIIAIFIIACSDKSDDANSTDSSKNNQSINELILGARNLRELLWKDQHRPKYHHIPPEGFFNDANGALFWKGRYHLFYLARTPIPNPEKSSKDKWVAVWDHVSSRDLVHWIHHPPSVIPKLDGSMPLGIYSGGAIKNAPRPTLIYHVPGQGACISIAQDDDLNEWKPFPGNPVIKLHEEEDEFVVYDPTGWYENGKYYALIGNKNKRPGYEGDCTSLFTSSDLKNWEYQGPFYQSRREWTLENEDAACPDFYPLGNSDTHMLLLHGHQPYRNITHYYLGKYENERFFPEHHGRMSWLGGQLSGPESLVDDKGRNIFFGWMAESKTGGESLWGYNIEVDPGKNDLYAWGSVVSLPRVMTLREDGQLGIEPAPEFEILRYNSRQEKDINIPNDKEVNLDNMSGNVMELFVEIDPKDANEVGVKVLCSPDNLEETVIVFTPSKNTLGINFQNSTVLDNVRYRGFFNFKQSEGSDAIIQEAPLQLNESETLKLRIFIDRSVLEVFANGRQCITQRIYPSKLNSRGTRLFAKGGSGKALIVKAWDMDQAVPW
ncbi:MAG: glycoside hydrolase family 32 protein [Candidatus Peribacteraceae bacterium]|jgi:sucrose-6-phosphate hydrolase SacC (GH32 family)|nr:glycoside hydrolase family 32 protein [Candidatus Peribacteraceae bacterium]|tara:strand:+ start:996 stop:2663 length:1668 start_codon:yes stop_codon:yes gene_type:complete